MTSPRSRISVGARLFRVPFCVLALSLFFLPFAVLHAQPSAQPGPSDLKMDDFLQRVLQRNESLQAKLLEVEINRRKARGEYGVFEPEVFGSFLREANNRENTVEQERNTLSTTGTFEELNNIYDGGLEALVPTGAKVRLGYTMRDLRNNLQKQTISASRGATNGEYQSFVGFSFTQPLLKNAWFPANLAGIRLAALSSDIAFQDYRRQLMVVISTAEASYWNLYMAQEQVRFFKESVATAERILNDTRDRVRAGISSELDMLEAEAGLALRRSKLSDANQKLYEAGNRLISLYAESVVSPNRFVRAVDRPQIGGSTNFIFFDAWKSAYESNPDYLTQRKKVFQEMVRLAYAKNQRLPELDFKGSYGLNGLGDSPGTSWDDIQQQDFPFWSIGIEMRIPLVGGIKSRNELAAARLREKEALVSLQEVETQIANALDTAIHKINSAHDSVQSYQTVVNFNQSLLDSALARLEVGKVESRKVLDIEADLFEARNSVVDALVQYQRAGLEFDLVAGAILKKRNLELTQKELESKTAQILRNGQLTDEQYAGFIKAVQLEYERKSAPLHPTDTPVQARARRALEEKMAEWPATNRPPANVSTNSYDALRDALRKKMEELKP